VTRRVLREFKSTVINSSQASTDATGVGFSTIALQLKPFDRRRFLQLENYQAQGWSADGCLQRRRRKQDMRKAGLTVHAGPAKVYSIGKARECQRACERSGRRCSRSGGPP